MRMKLYQIKFKPLWPVPCGLILFARDQDDAETQAKETIPRTQKIYSIEEVEQKRGVVFYESGGY